MHFVPTSRNRALILCFGFKMILKIQTNWKSFWCYSFLWKFKIKVKNPPLPKQSSLSSNPFLSRKNILFCFAKYCYFILLNNGSYTYAYFRWILCTIKMKFGQIIVCCLINIPDMYLVHCWRLDTSSRSFYDFIKMTI